MSHPYISQSHLFVKHCTEPATSKKTLPATKKPNLATMIKSVPLENVLIRPCKKKRSIDFAMFPHYSGGPQWSENLPCNLTCHASSCISIHHCVADSTCNIDNDALMMQSIAEAIVWTTRSAIMSTSISLATLQHTFATGYSYLSGLTVY